MLFSLLLRSWLSIPPVDGYAELIYITSDRYIPKTYEIEIKQAYFFAKEKKKLLKEKRKNNPQKEQKWTRKKVKYIKQWQSFVIAEI